MLFSFLQHLSKFFFNWLLYFGLIMASNNLPVVPTVGATPPTPRSNGPSPIVGNTPYYGHIYNQPYPPPPPNSTPLPRQYYNPQMFQGHQNLNVSPTDRERLNRPRLQNFELDQTFDGTFNQSRLFGHVDARPAAQQAHRVSQGREMLDSPSTPPTTTDVVVNAADNANSVDPGDVPTNTDVPPNQNDPVHPQSQPYHFVPEGGHRYDPNYVLHHNHSSYHNAGTLHASYPQNVQQPFYPQYPRQQNFPQRPYFGIQSNLPEEFHRTQFDRFKRSNFNGRDNQQAPPTGNFMNHRNNFRGQQPPMYDYGYNPQQPNGFNPFNQQPQYFQPVSSIPMGHHIVTTSEKKFNHKIRYWSILSWIAFLDDYNAHANLKHKGEDVYPGACFEDKTFDLFYQRLEINITLVRDGVFNWDCPFRHNSIPTQSILKNLDVNDFVPYANLSLFNHVSTEVEKNLNSIIVHYINKDVKITTTQVTLFSEAFTKMSMFLMFNPHQGRGPGR